jgi:hypothetical protein
LNAAILKRIGDKHTKLITGKNDKISGLLPTTKTGIYYALS